MAENSTPRKVTRRACQCMLGWKGLTDGGSSLEMADDPGHICDRQTRKSFAQGHDARMSSRLAIEIAKGWTPAEVAAELVQRAGGSAALVSKMLHSARLRMEKDAKVNAEDEMDAAGAENMAADEDISLDDARERMGLEPLADNEPADGPADEDAFPELPELGAEWSVKHGKRNYKATVIEAHTGERVASHKLGQGRDCYHDLSTGEIVDLSADAEDDDEVPF